VKAQSDEEFDWDAQEFPFAYRCERCATAGQPSLLGLRDITHHVAEHNEGQHFVTIAIARVDRPAR
jgi:hypothetical protein